MTPEDFRVALQIYCTLTGASVTSYGRTTFHNTQVGGVLFSAHQFWLAADVVYDAPGTDDWRNQVATRLRLHRLVENDHDHLQPVDWAKLA